MIGAIAANSPKSFRIIYRLEENVGEHWQTCGLIVYTTFMACNDFTYVSYLSAFIDSRQNNIYFHTLCFAAVSYFQISIQERSINIT